MAAIINSLCILLLFSIVGMIVASPQSADFSAGSWMSMASLPLEMNGSRIASAEVNGMIYVFGEMQNATNGSAYLGNYRYDPETDGWKEMSPLPIKRMTQRTSRFLLSVGMTLRWWVLGEHGGGSATAMLSPLLKLIVIPSAARNLL